MAEKKGELLWREEVVSLEKPASTYELSKVLKNIIVESKLYTPIHGKDYVNVEGWQLAGALTGLYPKVKSVERVASDTNEIKYRAEVGLFNIKDGKTVGFGVAFCSNLESKKRTFDEYAIASMAQTRAVGKAYRLTLGWLMKLAGYEATPSEEMPEVEGAEVVGNQGKPWQGSGKATEKQVNLLAYLLKDLGKSQAEVDAVVAKAKDATSAEVSRWIDDARDRIDNRKVDTKAKFEAITKKGRDFTKAVEDSMTPEQAEQMAELRAEIEAENHDLMLEQDQVLNEERMAGY